MKKILIIEDNQQILTHLSYIAQEINSSNKIYAFKNLDEAYRCALENDIDLFIVDIILEKEKPGCEFPYKSRVMGTSEPLKPLKAPYMARNPVKWVFFRLKGQEIPLKI